MTRAELIALMPQVEGLEYGTLTETGIWRMSNPKYEQVEMDGGLADLATAVTRSVFTVGGNPQTGEGWVGEIGVFDAGTDTPQIWTNYANNHNMLMLGGPPVAPDTYTVNRLPGVWRAVGNEIAITAEAEDGDFAASWFHDRRIWAVTGYAQMRQLAEGIIAQQDTAGGEPERFDITTLEGPLGGMVFDVPNYELVDYQPADVVSALQGLGKCVEHLSLHGVTMAGLHDSLMDVLAYGYSGLESCGRGGWIIDDMVANGGTRQDIAGVPAAIAPNGTQMVIVTDTGIVIQAFVAQPDTFALLAPVLENLASWAAQTQI